MNIFDSYIQAGQDMSKRDREQYYTALIEYLAYGIEPKVKGAALAVITAIRPSLDESRRCIVNGRKGGRPRKNPNPENAGTQTPKTEKANALDSEKPSNEKPETQTPESAKPKSKSKGKGKEPPNGGSSGRFAKPTFEQVSDYAAELGNPTFDAAHFIDYYESNGWKVGRNPMKDWKATVRNWVRKDSPQAKGGEYNADYD